MTKPQTVHYTPHTPLSSEDIAALRSGRSVKWKIHKSLMSSPSPVPPLLPVTMAAAALLSVTLPDLLEGGGRSLRQAQA